MMLEDAIVGRRYRVSGRDCCVSVTFTAMLVAAIPVESSFPEDQGMIGEWEFDNGARIHGHAVTCELVEEKR